MREIRLVHVLTVPESLVFLRGQMGFMKARGFDITVVCSGGRDLAEFAEREGVAVRAVEMPRRIAPLEDARAVAELTAFFRKTKPDIVHSHTPKGGLLGMISARAAGVPARLYHLRGLPFVTARGARRALLRSTERVSCALSHRVLCVSPSVRRVAIEAGVVRGDRIDVLHHGSGNGVDARERFDPGRLPPGTRSSVRRELGIPEDAVVVGFVGRLVRDKGVAELLSAWERLRVSRPGARLVIVGEHEARDPLPDAVKARLGAGEDAAMKVVGFRRDVERVYTAFDVVALPTYREGLPNVVLEAGAMGLPVVATRIPGCVDAVRDGVTGRLVPPGDARALADALAGYVDDAALRAEHGAAARKHVTAAFDQERLWDALLDVYERLLGEGGSASRHGRPG